MDSKQKTCENCKNFRRHYIVSEGRIKAVSCGSCVRYKKPRYKTDCDYREIKLTVDSKKTIEVCLKNALQLLESAMILSNS